MSETRTA